MQKRLTWKLNLIDARLYFVSIFVGLFTGLIAVPYHYLLQLFFDARKQFIDSSPSWFWYIPLFILLWLILVFVAWMVRKMPLITGGGIPQTRGVINGRVAYRHPFIELIAKFTGGVLSLSAGLSLGREGPSVQIGSYVGCLIAKWTKVLAGERKQLLAAGAGAGLAAAFAAPLASSLLVIESIERFDAPKTAITTLLAGVVAGGVASLVFPVNMYHQIDVIVPALTFWMQVKIYILLAVVISAFGKFYSEFNMFVKHKMVGFRQPVYLKMLYLLIVAFIISLTEVTLTGGGEEFLLNQAIYGSDRLGWVVAMMLIHFVFSALSFSSGLPGGSFIPTLVTGGLFGEVVGLVLVRFGIIGPESVSYFMLICMAGLLVAVIRTPLTAIVLITEITGHFEVFYPSVVVGGLTYYLTQLIRIKPFNVLLYDEMVKAREFKQQKRYQLFVEIMSGAYLDGKQADRLTLPENCVILSIHRNGKDLKPDGRILKAGDQVEIEMDSQDIEKLYEPLVSMANIY